MLFRVAGSSLGLQGLQGVLLLFLFMVWWFKKVVFGCLIEAA